ncbi:5'-3' exonuclease [Egibacter rhizosphaerae]|uniref:5'-3' exonuclease n=1 Tax=Egibacter rhizosphaerae TaxID=1670831 RepID=UPI0013F173EC|nr:5'-3' exonuclease H3TH domain-containing protein [Egibacter rhizosphaerae]
MDALTLFDAELNPRAAGSAVGVDTAAAPPRPAAAPWSTTAAQAAAGPRVLAVDGDSVAHRAYHAYANGRGGRYGFLALLAAICDEAGADGLIVGFDCRERSHRRDLEPSYKAQRGDKPDDLVELLDRLPHDLTRLGLCAVVAPGWEADDVVASAAASAEARGWGCAVATSDRDAYALATERTTVLRLRNAAERTEHLTPQRLRRKLGIEPARYVQYAALRGDTSDNLPGVPGIGPRRAAALLEAFDDVEAAGADPIGCRSVLGREAGQALLDDLARGPDSVHRRNVALMNVRRDLDVDLDAAFRRPAPQTVAATLDGWGLGPLAGRLAAAVGARPDAVPLPETPLDG